jgi:hypothetical protein
MKIKAAISYFRYHPLKYMQVEKIARLWYNNKGERTSKLQETQIYAYVPNATIYRINKLCRF